MKTIQKKEYTCPLIEVCAIDMDKDMLIQYSFGETDTDDEVGAKGGFFDDEEDDDPWQW